MEFERLVPAVALMMEGAGIAVLVVGTLVATTAFIARLRRRTAFDNVYDAYRADLGRAILLGLEFLVAADIVGTVAIEPTFRSLGVLALIVLIRTFLSFTLELDIHGRWPWQRGGDRTTGG